MKNQISERLIDFVANILKIVGELPPKTIAVKLSDQLIRSSTSVGANYEEAQAAARQLRAILSKSVATAKGTAKPVEARSWEHDPSSRTSSSPI